MRKLKLGEWLDSPAGPAQVQAMHPDAGHYWLLTESGDWWVVKWSTKQGKALSYRLAREAAAA